MTLAACRSGLTPGYNDGESNPFAFLLAERGNLTHTRDRRVAPSRGGRLAVTGQSRSMEFGSTCAFCAEIAEFMRSPRFSLPSREPPGCPFPRRGLVAISALKAVGKTALTGIITPDSQIL
jgi:hypothetical protein